MRLIDAEPYAGCRIVANREDSGVSIDEIKTVDAVPVAHGRWERTDIISAGLLLRNRQSIVEHRCSVCDRYSILFEGHIEENFCPHCGAKMGEVSE